MTAMKHLLLAAPLAALPLVLAPLAAAPRAQEGGTSDMAAMMEKAKKLTQPGEHHVLLERFLGRWKTETRFFMGGQPTPPEAGTAEFSWLMPGRWLQGKSKGSMMRMPLEGFHLLGYDNFKQSYVTCHVSNLDTAMNCSEGDLDPGGKALLTYGTLDEYLTGEHDKMVKYVWRFRSEDEIALEVHDLPIGEQNTKVVEITFRREES
jgi:hypothetical protein